MKTREEGAIVAEAAADRFVEYWTKLIEQETELDTEGWRKAVGTVFFIAFYDGYELSQQKMKELTGLN